MCREADSASIETEAVALTKQAPRKAKADEI